ncbi:MAG: 30S ribosomal protein S3, partial [Deltaproteobacteria bacterium HGW-Deltaproteobacteria-7]
MGQKVNPVGLRLGYIKKWQSVWFAEKNYSGMLLEDLKVRKYLKKKLYHAGISRIEIERAANKAKVNIYAARPGVIIGKKGSEIEKLKAEIEKFSKAEIIINILEIRKPETDAQLVAENVAMQLERRVVFWLAVTVELHDIGALVFEELIRVIVLNLAGLASTSNHEVPFLDAEKSFIRGNLRGRNDDGRVRQNIVS